MSLDESVEAMRWDGNGSPGLPWLPSGKVLFIWLDIDLVAKTIGFGFTDPVGQGMRTGQQMLEPIPPFPTEPRFKTVSLGTSSAIPSLPGAPTPSFWIDDIVIR